MADQLAVVADQEAEADNIQDVGSNLAKVCNPVRESGKLPGAVVPMGMSREEAVVGNQEVVLCM